ncbi:DUF2391 family protein [Candidatus Woesearchaeota archaeon]|nr:DUF2391 family protein [Candidatus Woesearchaeota archaeon]
MPKNIKTKIGFKAGKLKETTAIHGEKSKLSRIISPLVVEFHPRDLLQIMVGAAILAIPVGFTEETWHLGETLPLPNIIMILTVSLLFISAFIYYNYYTHHRHLRKHVGEYLKRVISTYLVSFIVVAFLLTIIQITTWVGAEWLISFKRVVIVTFPASMSAAVADTFR